jgi:hypothetical protein
MTFAQQLPGVPGGIGLDVDGYAEFLAKDYLGDYIRAGGGAVRLVVTGDDEVAARWHRRLAAISDGEGYYYVPIDAARTRVHLLHEVFLAVSREIDWLAGARAVVQGMYDEIGFPADDGAVDVAAVAARHKVDAHELRRSVRRGLESGILGDVALAFDFRVAMLRLCQSLTGGGDVHAEERDLVLAWLHGEPVSLARLRTLRIPGRIGRHNARSLILSTANWLVRSRGRGVVLDFDLARLAVARRPPVEVRDGVYYSKAAVLDAYETLRQLIDATDNLRCALVAVAIPPELVTDEARGLPSYSALHLRVADEVRDRRRANPYAGLVRLEARMEAVR